MSRCLRCTRRLRLRRQIFTSLLCENMLRQTHSLLFGHLENCEKDRVTVTICKFYTRHATLTSDRYVDNIEKLNVCVDDDARCMRCTRFGLFHL